NDAAEMLRKHSGVRRFVFLGQSLGATIAATAARTRTDVVGLQLITPVVKGRAYVRELTATATMVAERIGIKADKGPDEGLSVIGFSLSRRLVEEIVALDLTRIPDMPVQAAVVYDQSDRKAAADLVGQLGRLGAKVVMETVAPYHLMVSDATAIQPLPASPATITASLRALHPTVVSTLVPPPPAFPTALVGPSYREEPVRFGQGRSLFGILCRPSHPRPGAAAYILLNRGLNAHIGWRRVSVEQARGLAAAGITSLRFDVAGLGESRDEPDRPVDLIYSDLLLPDISASVDLMVSRGHARIALAGVCSGAYMALVAAEADKRITDVVAVNAQRIVWNPRESVEEVIRYGLRSMNDYVGDIRSRGALRKLVKSRRRIVPALRFLAKRAARHALARVPIAVRRRVAAGSMAARVAQRFEAYADHGTRVALLFSAADPGLAELAHYYGPDGRDLAHDNVAVAIIPGTDHNLTTREASAWMLERMVAFVGTQPPRVDVGPTRQPQAPRNAAVCAS
ncbi:alpha/beta fold hydrolase, partial [Jatrophihabitans endophyticus]|uniref:alpha/beta fold hydrolase n=1 Tax=Jatrophihabitans endophyticus TaxID=1206085 RepID=UPI0026F17D56